MASSIRSIAQATKLSICTVSKALRNDLKVAKATRERVRAEAEKQGYRPNPALSRAAGRRAKTAVAQAGEPLAVIRNVAPGTQRPQRFGSALLRSIHERAAELGYAPVIYEPASYPSIKAMERVIYSRGVRGIILAGFLGPHPEGLPLHWERFAGVWTVQRWLPIELPLIRTSYLNTIRNCITEIIKLGYQRLGVILVLQPRHPRNTQLIIS